MKIDCKSLSGAAAAALLSAQSIAADLPDAAADDMAVPDSPIFAALGELRGGYRGAHSGGPNTSYVNLHGAAFAGAARVSVPLMDRFSIQFDGDVEYYPNPDGHLWEPLGLWLAGGHASLRDPSRGLIGIFGAVGHGLQSDFDNSSDYELGFLLGAEGQIYFGDFTLYAQAGYGDFEADNEPEGFIEGWFARGVGRWFPTDDSLLEADMSYGSTHAFVDGVDNGHIWNLGVQGKMRVLTDYPVYATAAYRYSHSDSTTEGDTGNEHIFLAGVNVLFGPNSLKDNDRLGATLDLPRLPARAAPWSEGLD
jgi:hypothetical protein